jgi:hypothetical protein
MGGKQETVLPYALNFTKHISNNISIIHVVDPQKQPAISSAYADSQSFEIAEKLSHDEIIDREKHAAGVLLDRLLSKEASRLNYPLRVNTIIETDSLENKLSDELDQDELSLFIISSELGGTILHDLDEFLEITKCFNNLSLIIPPGHQFSIPEKVFILYDFESPIHDSIFKVMDSLKVFKPLVNVADVIEERNDVKYIEMEIKSTAWQQLASEYAGPDIRLATNILTGKQYTEAVLNFIKRNNYNLVAIPKNIKEPANPNIFSKHVSKQLINQLEVPVMLY